MLTLIELIGGVAFVIFGLVKVVLGSDNAMPYYLACANGAASFLFGVRGALIANVPARIGQIVGFGAVVCLVQAACAAGIVYATGADKVETALPEFIPACVLALITLIAVLLARGMAKRAER